jgi:aryl-alcohol dehydrogenase-like predicted oxidoreductase
MDKLVDDGKLISYGAALGPAVGWLQEGIEVLQKRDISILQHIYNMLEQYPGRPIMDAATEAGKSDTRFLIRVTHSSGMLEGHYTEDTTFPPTDHRSHRPRSWLLNGLKKIETLKFLVDERRTLGQVALQWLLADDRIASTLPNIYNSEQIKEFAAAPDTPALTREELDKVRALFADNFGVEEPPMKFKGTMEPREASTA